MMKRLLSAAELNDAFIECRTWGMQYNLANHIGALEELVAAKDAEIERLKAKLEESERALDEATEGMSITQDAVFMPIRIQRNGVTICQSGERPALAAYLLSGHGVK